MKHTIRRSLPYIMGVLISILISSCGKQSFITVENGQFYKDGKPYYYIGTNFWYGAILGSKGTGGNRERLLKELDALEQNGVTNLRILVGADGLTAKSKIQPSLQISAGVYNDEIFDGLDFLLAQMRERGMSAVLFLNNSWEWSGGYGQYLEWAGEGKVPAPSEVGYPAFMNYVSKFVKSDKAKQLFANHVEKVICRTNRYTNEKYVDDPTIMSWQIGNEPRAFSDDSKEAFAEWISEAAAQIESLDPNHLISVGSEGSRGCEDDINLWEKIHNDINIDYLTFHIWPKNWSWIDVEDVSGSLGNAINHTEEYLNMHLAIADKLNKPLVLEEFGYPRDGHSIDPRSTTSARDKYFAYVFDELKSHKDRGGKFAGCNFWAWAGYGKANHESWQMGDDYLGDPAQEPQGLNSVFVTDETTMNEISKSTKQIY